MVHTRRYVNKAKYAPKMTDSLKPLDVAELLKKKLTAITSRLKLSVMQLECLLSV